MNSKLYLFSKIVVFSLILIGLSVVGITTHELKHYYDLEDKEGAEICVLNLPTEYNGIRNILFEGTTGYVLGSFKEGETSELQASILGILIMIILIIIISVYIREEVRREFLIKMWEEE